MEQIIEFAKEIVDRYIKSMGYNPQTIDRNKRMALTKTARFQQYAQRMQTEQLNDSPKLMNRPYTKGLAQSRAHTKDMALKRSVHVNKPQMPVRTESVGNDIPQTDKSPEEWKKQVTHHHPTASFRDDSGHGKPGTLGHHTTHTAWVKQKDNTHRRVGIWTNHASQTPVGKPRQNHAHIDLSTHHSDVREAMEFPQDTQDPKGCGSKAVSERRKEMSKSARIIKAIYKKHKMTEELYDHEKDDKDGGTYGQKPKFVKAGKEQVSKSAQDDGKSKASAVLTGGTTLTGQKRDDVQFDPVLNKPNVRSDASGLQVDADKQKINK